MRVDFGSLNEHKLNNPLQQQWRLSPNSRKTPTEQQRAVSFTVSYPYGVSRSISPQAIEKQMSYLSAKKALPVSTLRFIQKNLISELEEANAREEQSMSSQQNLNKTADLDRSLDSQSVQGVEDLWKTQSKRTVSPMSKTPIITKNYENNVKSRVYQEKLMMRYRPQKPKPPPVNYSHTPSLRYTKNSKVNKQVTQRRNRHFNTCKINVFDSLYKDADVYVSKREAQKIITEEHVRSKSKERDEIKRRVQTTFEQRYEESLQKQAERYRKAARKASYETKSGRKYFVPNTKPSKRTYTNLFKPNERELTPPEVDPVPARASHYSKQSSKFNQSLQLTSTQIQSFRQQVSDLLSPTLQKSRDQNEKKPALRHVWVGQIYADLLLVGQSLDLSKLQGKEQVVLSPMLEKFKSFKYGQQISRQVFLTIFKDYYEKMNLHDRQIIDRRLNHAQRLQKMTRQQQRSVEKNPPASAQVKKKFPAYRLDYTYKSLYI